MSEAFWKYVGLISGILTICGAVVVILTALALSGFNHFGHSHISSVEITWISFLAGVGAAGVISVAYGVSWNHKIVGGGDQNKQAFIGVISGVILILVAALGVAVPATNAGGTTSTARHSCTQSSTGTTGNRPKGHAK